METQVFYRTVRERIGERDRDEAERGTAAVFHALRDRLTPEESAQVVAQLPARLKAVWEADEKAGRQPVKMHREEFYERVRQEVGLASDREAQWLTLAVFGALKAQLSPGESEDVLAQLPRDLKEVWVEAP
jgi:uncharacterized protein (DUF2267 family)